jgi:hypothetical protein
MTSISIAAFRDPCAPCEALCEQVGRTEREGNTTGKSGFPSRAFHGGVFR